MGNKLSAAGPTSGLSDEWILEEKRIRQEMRMVPLDEPSAFRQLHMSPELLEYLQEEEFFSCEAEQIEILGQQWAIERAVDHPHIPEHIYYESYGHARADPAPISSMNPRWGHAMDKAQGPLRIVAFLRCFKEINDEWIQRAFREDPTGYFTQLIDEDLHLSDLAIQFHWGDEIAGYDIGWHNDGRNSALHMAIGVRGKRALHMSRVEEGHTAHYQKPGDFYIGTPFTARHAVEYPACSFDDRVIAIQARFLFPTKREAGPQLRDVDIPTLMRLAVDVIQNAKIQVPTVEQVKEWHHRLSEQVE